MGRLSYLGSWGSMLGCGLVCCPYIFFPFFSHSNRLLKKKILVFSMQELFNMLFSNCIGDKYPLPCTVKVGLLVKLATSRLLTSKLVFTSYLRTFFRRIGTWSRLEFVWNKWRKWAAINCTTRLPSREEGHQVPSSLLCDEVHISYVVLLSRGDLFYEVRFYSVFFEYGPRNGGILESKQVFRPRLHHQWVLVLFWHWPYWLS